MKRRPCVGVCVAAAIIVISSLVSAGSSSATAPNWTRLFPVPSPTARDDFSMAYDPATQDVVLFGGRAGAGRELSDTWVWDGTTWTNKTPTNPALSPPARVEASMAYDAATHDVVLFGGGNGTGGELSDTWVWNGTTWTNRTPANTALSPSARFYYSMATDPATQGVVLFGGSDGSAVLSDTWVWDGTTWTNTTPANPALSPPARTEGAMAFDAATHDVVLFGGASSTGGFLSDTWVWDGTTWTNTTPANPTLSPSARNGSAMAYDGATQDVVLLGGYDGSTPLSDTWVWSRTTWSQQLPATSPPARTEASMAADPATHQLVLFAGNNFSATLFSDTWVWQGVPLLEADITVSPSTGSSLVRTTHALTARVTDSTSGAPLAGQRVTFSVGGANAGTSSTCVPTGCRTNSAGTVTFTYTGTHPGNDTITASVTVSGTIKTDRAAMTWTTSARNPPNIFQVELRNCTNLHVGYDNFPPGTVVHWNVSQHATTVSTNQFTALGGGQTKHFLSQPLGVKLQPSKDGVVHFQWVVKGTTFSHTVARKPGC